MSAINLPRVKKVINSLTMADANEALAGLEGIHSSREVIEIAEGLIERKGLDRYVRLNRDSS
jgi:signal transduction protein with GAF and PtsI domain